MHPSVVRRRRCRGHRNRILADAYTSELSPEKPNLWQVPELPSPAGQSRQLPPTVVDIILCKFNGAISTSPEPVAMGSSLDDSPLTPSIAVEERDIQSRGQSRNSREIFESWAVGHFGKSRREIRPRASQKHKPGPATVRLTPSSLDGRGTSSSFLGK